YFLTDLQARTWGGLTKTAPTADAKKQSDLVAAVASIAERASLVVVDLGHANASNLAVTNLSASAAAATAWRDVGLDAVVHNFGQEPHPKCRVELLVDDEAVGEQTVDFAASGESSFHFVHRFPSAGAHAVTIRTSGDRLEVDNSRSLVLPMRSEI